MKAVLKYLWAKPNLLFVVMTVKNPTKTNDLIRNQTKESVGYLWFSSPMEISPLSWSDYSPEANSIENVEKLMTNVVAKELL